MFLLKNEGLETVDQKWVKSGVEFYENEVYIGTVAADRWADWSLVNGRDSGVEGGEVTMEMERHPKDGTLWVYILGEGGVRKPLRECTWMLSEEGEAWVGVYAATPTVKDEKGEGREALEVRFKGWELELME